MKMLWILPVLFCTLPFLSTAQDSLPNDGDGDSAFERSLDAYYDGVAAFNTGKYDSAVRFFKECIRNDKEFIEAFNYLGLTFRKLNMLDSAVIYYEKTLGLYPQHQMAMRNLAVIYEVEFDFTSALTTYKKLIKYYPEDPEGFYGAARMFLIFEEFEESLAHAEQAVMNYRLRSDEHLGDGYYLLALANLYAGKRENATRYGKMAILEGFAINDEMRNLLGLTQ